VSDSPDARCHQSSRRKCAFAHGSEASNVAGDDGEVNHTPKSAPQYLGGVTLHAGQDV